MNTVWYNIMLTVLSIVAIFITYNLDVVMAASLWVQVVAYAILSLTGWVIYYTIEHSEVFND